MARNDKHIVYGSVAGNFKGGFEWKITNSIEDAILRNATDIEVVMWGSQPGTYTSYDLNSSTSSYKLTVGSLTETVNIKTKTDWREGREKDKVYYAGSSYPLKVTSGTAVAKFTINHNADGTAPTVKLETEWTADAVTFQGIITSATLVIPEIPRATTPVVSPKTQACGGSVTIDLSSRVIETFKHTLSYRLGSASGIIVSKTADTEYSWTIPASLASQFATTSNSQTLVITCDTYQGNSLIGSKQVSITVTLPAEYAPNITINSVTNLEGNNRFLQDVDGVRVNFSVTLKDGASSIKSAALSIGGITYALQSPESTENLSLRSQVISSSGDLPYSLAVTDNRGMRTEVPGTVSFTVYSSPAITLYAKRDSNNPATVNITGSVSHNLAFTCYIDYRVRNTASWATLATLPSLNNTLDITEDTTLLLQAQAWEVRARVVDSVYGLETTRIVYVTAVVTYSEKKGGRAAAFFGSATDVPDGTMKVFGNIDAVNITAENVTALEQTVSEFGVQKVLWNEGPYYMRSDHTAELSELVSEQNNGIILVWSAYESGVKDYNFFYQFVPKSHVESHNGKGVNTGIIATETFGTIGSKYVYVYDDRITGNDYNDDSGTKNGITFNNAYWVLRYVLGV